MLNQIIAYKLAVSWFCFSSYLPNRVPYGGRCCVCWPCALTTVLVPILRVGANELCIDPNGCWRNNWNRRKQLKRFILSEIHCQATVYLTHNAQEAEKKNRGKYFSLRLRECMIVKTY